MHAPSSSFIDEEGFDKTRISFLALTISGGHTNCESKSLLMTIGETNG
jgi:hypothetical protein